MATVRALRTSGLILLLFLINTLAVSPWITSVDVDNALCDEFNCNYRIKVSGGLREWSLTSRVKNRGDVCSDNLMLEKSNVFVDLTVPVFDKLYFCGGRDGVLYHEGPGLYLIGGDVISRELPQASENEVIPHEIEDVSETDTKYYNDLNINKYGEEIDDGVETLPNSDDIRKKREANETEVTDVETSSLGEKTIQPNVTLKVMGLRVEEGEKEPKIVDGMIPSVLRETKFTLRLFGEGFTDDTWIAFTHHPQAYGSPCRFLIQGEYKINVAEHDSGLFELIAPPPLEDYKFYICARNTPNGELVHQGSEGWKILATHNKLLPLWASLILIVILLVMASLFSGLNLGLMALDRTELRIIANTGTEKERKYARAIMPVRAHGNYLLCTILLSNVAVNSTFTVILDDLTSGLYAVIGSTLAIVFIAEITPQAICARHGLLIGAKSIWIMKIVMGICAPLAWPTSKLLDYFLGEEIGTHYNRERLKELVKVTNHVNDLDKEEVNIISGALDLRKKTVKDVMTKLKDCFMLPINTVLDFETMTEIVKSDRYYQNPCNFVFEDVTLDVMLKQFKEGHKGHMAFVQRIEEGDGDPVYETVGLVTLEDVIEEMIQAEIVDESDVISDNRTKKRLARPLNKLHDIAAFAGHQHQRVHVSPQLVLATFQFLSTSVDPFRADMISETVLRRLLKQDVIQHIRLRGDEEKNDPKRFVYQEGKPVDYFVLILEGRVEVTVGRENLVFEAGPFTYFGVQALTQNVGLAESPAPSTLGSLQNLNMDSMLRHTFVPDYSVKAIAELYYLTIKRSMYLAAKRATLMEKGVLNKGGTNEQIEPEVDKLLREGDRLDDIVENEKTTPSKQFVPQPSSLLTNSTFKTAEPETKNPEEEKLLKK
ncbi:metal transporter CNNM4-like [Zerene cesonia]|uniref:metal transporter CNNM4-like n=1 Tax=Zerene cesonia TaxID=33412 RepID=UPI0018E515CA|nr:metal transporter CNNM4-like [Zerene cesonia]